MQIKCKLKRCYKIGSLNTNKASCQDGRSYPTSSPLTRLRSRRLWSILGGRSSSLTSRLPSLACCRSGYGWYSSIGDYHRIIFDCFKGFIIVLVLYSSTMASNMLLLCFCLVCYKAVQGLHSCSIMVWTPFWKSCIEA